MEKNNHLNSDGFLDAGFHNMNLAEFRSEFINCFPSSKTRDTIFTDFYRWCHDLVSHYHVYEIWVDGSFVTSKINPNDVDCVVFFYSDGYLDAAPKWNVINNIPTIDAYFTLAICPENESVVSPAEYHQFVNNRNYWRGQFGFDRSDHPKGIVAISPDDFTGGN